MDRQRKWKIRFLSKGVAERKDTSGLRACKGLNSISPLGTWSELIIVNEARNRLLQARAL